MEKFMDLYRLWSTDPYFDKETQAELEAIKSNPQEIEDRFYRDLAFGTGGLRGILGAGTNRMNGYTVAKATAGLAQYILSEGEEAAQRGVAISYDSRHFSPEFSRVAAEVLTGAGIRVFLSDSLRPVPLLSYAVRHFQAFAGIMITASHNPPKYNGYKVYGEDGGQVTLEAADRILANIESISDIRTIPSISIHEAEKKGLLKHFGEDLDEAYTAMLLDLVIDPDAVKKHQDMPIVYTPLHGSGNKPVRRILQRVGFKNVHVVPEQEQPDGAFPTVATPNPEDPKALRMGIALAEKVSAALVIGTDPDSDRVGVAVRTTSSQGKTDYVPLTGNQIGVLLLDYILSSKKAAGTLPENSFAVTTIVSSKLAAAICQYYGVELQEVLTGFKFIGERIRLDDEEGNKHFQFGFEESYGYLVGLDVRDKDAVVASMLIATMAAQSLERKETLLDRLHGLYARFGYGIEDAVSFTLEGKAGVEKIEAIMTTLRENLLQGAEGKQKSCLPNLTVMAARDYQAQIRYLFSGTEVQSEAITLPKSNVLLYELGGVKGLDWVCVRPSGTEPKLKIYFGIYEDNESKAKARLESIKGEMVSLIEGWL